MKTFRQYITEELKDFDKETMCIRWKKKDNNNGYIGLDDNDFIDNDRREDQYGNEMGKPKQGIEAKKFPCWQSSHKIIRAVFKRQNDLTGDELTAEDKEVITERYKIFKQLSKQYGIRFNMPTSLNVYNGQKPTVENARQIGESLRIMTEFFPDLPSHIKKIQSYESELEENTNNNDILSVISSMQDDIEFMKKGFNSGLTKKFWQKKINRTIDLIKDISPDLLGSSKPDAIAVFNWCDINVKFDENGNLLVLNINYDENYTNKIVSVNKEDTIILQKLLSAHHLDKNVLTTNINDIDEKTKKSLYNFIQAYAMYTESKELKKTLDKYKKYFDENIDDIFKQYELAYCANIDNLNSEITIVNQNFNVENKDGWHSCGGQFEGDGGENITDTMNHEIGHAISRILQINRFNGDAMNSVTGREYHTYVPASDDEDVLALYQIYDKMEQADNENIYNSRKNLLSIYGMANQEEMIAESIAHFVRYKGKSKPFVKAIMTHINNIAKKKGIKFNIDENDLQYDEADLDPVKKLEKGLENYKKQSASMIKKYLKDYDIDLKDAEKDFFENFTEGLTQEDLANTFSKNEDLLDELVKAFCEDYIEKNKLTKKESNIQTDEFTKNFTKNEKDAIISIYDCIKKNNYENIDKDDMSLLVHNIEKKAPDFFEYLNYYTDSNKPELFYATIKIFINKLKNGEEISRSDYYNIAFEIEQEFDKKK